MALRLATLLFLLTQLLAFATAAFDFAPYPACAQTYLYSNAPSSCDFGNTNTQDTSEEDQCLCNDINFLDAVAQDFWEYCGCDVLTSSANILIDACAAYGVNAIYTAEQIIQAGDGGKLPCQNAAITTTPAAVVPTSSQDASQPTSQDLGPTPLSAPTSPSSASSSSSSSTASALAPFPASSSVASSSSSTSDAATGLQEESNKIALGCGLGLGLPTLLLAIWAAIVKCTRRTSMINIP